MEKIFNASVTNRKEVAENTFEINFEVDDYNFSFVPGQYVWVVLNELKYPDERGNRRAFSIVSNFKDGDNRISCVFRKSESGFKKTLIEMPIGSKIRIDGPFGFCGLPQDEATPVIFIAGGVGIASVFTMINNAVRSNSSRKIVLIYGNSSRKKAVYLDELENIQRENKNFTLISHFGNLNQKIIFNNTKDLTGPIWYIFGPEDMVFEVGKMLVENNVQPDRIETEEFRFSASRFYRENTEAIETNRSLKMALDGAFNHLIFTDLEGRILYANHGAEIITGYGIKEMINNTPRLRGGLMSDDFYKSLWKTIKEDKKMFEGEVKNRKKSGDVYTARIKIAPFFSSDDGGNLLGFIGVEEDITKEKEIEKMRTDFLSLASHQLRTPLSGTKWLIETLNRKILGPVTKQQQEYLDQIYQINERMIKLVFDMLNVLRMESGFPSVQNKKIPMSAVYHEVIATSDSLAKKKGVLVKNISKDQGMIETDVQILSIILDCLISNAVNYSKEGGEILFDSKKEATGAVFSVKDSGIGIPKEEQKWIYEKFYRASNAKKFEPNGTGLGLYFASMLAEKIGAKLTFESEEGKGSVFYLRIPEKVG